MLSKSWIELPQARNRRQVFWRWLLGDYIRRAVSRANLYVAIERERKALSRLSDAELRDIGVHRAEADAESRRVFFDVPEDRLHLHSDADGNHDCADQRCAM